MDTVLIFAGGDAPTQSLIDELPNADWIVAADSGYDTAIAQGFSVDLLVGDLDSIEASDIPPGMTVERHSPDKDATDLELALARVIGEQPRRIVVVGGSGGRIDHELATAALLCSDSWADMDELDWVSDRGWGHVVWDRRIIHGDIGTMLTLIPMGGAALGVQTKGLQWDLQGEILAYGTTRGVSNVFTGPVADIRVTGGCLLALIPRV